MRQDIIELNYKQNYYYEDFIINESNVEAFNLINNWPNWNHNQYNKIIFLYGPKSSGKSHLSNIWLNKSKAYLIKPSDVKRNKARDLIFKNNCFLIENLEYLKNEEFLFNLINICKEFDSYLLINSSIKPANLNLQLPDLASRINSLNYIEIKEPNEEILKAMLNKRLFDYQIRLNLEAENYIFNRINRDYCSVIEFADLINKKSLEEKRNITIPFLRELLK